MGAHEKPKASVIEVESHPFVGGRSKELGFLVKAGDKFVSAATCLQKLTPAVTKGLRFAFDCWLQGIHKPRRHHGWDRSEHGGRHTNCYVFKHYDGSRIYGFLLNPSASPRAQGCCLVHFTEKHQDKTELGILDAIEGLCADPENKLAVETYWNEKTAERRRVHEEQK